MATIRKEILLEAPAETVWDALRDVGALHTRLVPGFVTATQLDGDARIVTFGNGKQAREDIVAIDEASRRLVWAIVGQGFTHYNGAAQVFAEGERRSRFVWITDLLPHEFAGEIDAAMELGIGVIKRTLEQAADGTSRSETAA